MFRGLVGRLRPRARAASGVYTNNWLKGRGLPARVELAFCVASVADADRRPKAEETNIERRSMRVTVTTAMKGRQPGSQPVQWPRFGRPAFAGAPKCPAKIERSTRQCCRVELPLANSKQTIGAHTTRQYSEGSVARFSRPLHSAFASIRPLRFSRNVLPFAASITNMRGLCHQ
jgi:hypothetical protein